MNEEALIIGAGQFGLSISPYLTALSVEHRLVGGVMDTSRNHIPSGMNLRSEPCGSDMAAPRPGHDVKAYCRRHGREHVDRLGPLSIETFLEYSTWFAAELAQPTTDLKLTDIRRVGGGFRVAFVDEVPVSARQLVVATGVLPHEVVPEPLSALPAELVTHASGHRNLSVLSGRRVAVIGGVQSALETVALLHEAGAEAQLVMRADAVNWLEPNPAHVSTIGRVRRPVNKLCEGWHCALWNNPDAFHLLPREMRAEKARPVLGPAGAWWLKDCVEGIVEAHAAHRVTGATPLGNDLRLDLTGPRLSSLAVDHVIAGTHQSVAQVARSIACRASALPTAIASPSGQASGSAA